MTPASNSAPKPSSGGGNRTPIRSCLRRSKSFLRNLVLKNVENLKVKIKNRDFTALPTELYTIADATGLEPMTCRLAYEVTVLYAIQIF